MNNFAYINDSIHGLILLSKHEKMFISSIGFNRLHDVYQDSTVYLTYPTNRTKRFEHSIGTMKLCSDMFYHSVLNTDNKILESFFCDFKSSLEKLHIDLSGDFIHSKFEYDLIPFNLKELGLNYVENIYILLIKSIRLAGLLHDIGHTPFSHVVENSLENIYEELSKYKKESESEKVKSFIKIMSKYSYKDKKLHENIGDYITSKIFDELITPEDKELKIIKKIVLEIFANNDIFKCLHRIVDSSIDADRLDYVTRDSISSGIDSGKIDYKRIIDGMKIQKHDKDFYVFSFQEKSLNSIEDFFRRRLELYKNVIYHHRVIKTDFILKNVVKELIMCYFSDCLFSDNEDFSIANLWGFLDYKFDIEMISQWNDSYIITVLRNIFFIFKNKKEYNNIYYELFEIFMGNKYSFSLIKRREHFKILDDSIKEELFNFYNSDYKKIKNKENYKMTLEIYDNIFSNRVSNFIFNYIFSKKDFLGLSMSELKSEIVNYIEKYLKLLNLSIVEVIIDSKTLSSGLNDEKIYFYKSDGNMCNINDISNIKYILEKDLEYFPIIYVYVFYESNEIRESLYKNREDILKFIGKNIGKYIINNYNKFIKKININEK